MELEHKLFWAIRAPTYHIKANNENQHLQLNDPDELRLHAYETAKVFKELVKEWHDQHIHKKHYKERDLLLLFNSHIKCLPRKLKS